MWLRLTRGEGLSYLGGAMQYRCAKCHTRLESEGTPQRCPTCKAEIGFDGVDHVPVAMKLFGALLGGVIAAAAAGSIVSRLAG